MKLISEKLVSNERTVDESMGLIFYRWSRLVEVRGRTRQYLIKTGISIELYNDQRTEVARQLRERRQQMQHEIAKTIEGSK